MPTMITTRRLFYPVDKRAFLYGGEGGIRPPPGGPGRGSDAPPARHSLPLGFESTSYDAKRQPRKCGTVFLVGEGGFELLKLRIF